MTYVVSKLQSSKLHALQNTKIILKILVYNNVFQVEYGNIKFVQEGTQIYVINWNRRINFMGG